MTLASTGHTRWSSIRLRLGSGCRLQTTDTQPTNQPNPSPSQVAQQNPDPTGVLGSAQLPKKAQLLSAEKNKATKPEIPFYQ